MQIPITCLPTLDTIRLLLLSQNFLEPISHFAEQKVIQLLSVIFPDGELFNNLWFHYSHCIMFTWLKFRSGHNFSRDLIKINDKIVNGLLLTINVFCWKLHCMETVYQCVLHWCIMFISCVCCCAVYLFMSQSEYLSHLSSASTDSVH